MWETPPRSYSTEPLQAWIRSPRSTWIRPQTVSSNNSTNQSSEFHPLERITLSKSQLTSNSKIGLLPTIIISATALSAMLLFPLITLSPTKTKTHSSPIPSILLIPSVKIWIVRWFSAISLDITKLMETQEEDRLRLWSAFRPLIMILSTPIRRTLHQLTMSKKISPMSKKYLPISMRSLIILEKQSISTQPREDTLKPSKLISMKKWEESWSTGSSTST